MRRARSLALLLALAATTPAAAQPGSDVKETKARNLFEAGGRAYDRGQFDVALQAFEQAYALSDRDGLLFSMAQAHRRLYTETRTATHRSEAIRLYRAYLGRVSSGGRREEANRFLGELEATPEPTAPADGATPAPAPPPLRRTRLYVSSGTEGAMVSVDGAAPVPANRTIEVTPGPHKIQIRAPGFVDHGVEVTAAENELLPVHQDLKELPGSVAIVATSGADLHVGGRFVGEAPFPSPLELPAGEHVIIAELPGHHTRALTVTVPRGGRVDADLSQRTTTQRDFSFAAFAVSGSGAIASGVLLGLALVEQSAAKDILSKQQSQGLEEGDIERYEDARSTRDAYAIGAAATGAAAGALFVTGLGLFLGDPPEKIDAGPGSKGPAEKPSRPLDGFDAAIAPLVLPGGAGVFVWGRM